MSEGPRSHPIHTSHACTYSHRLCPMQHFRWFSGVREQMSYVGSCAKHLHKSPQGTTNTSLHDDCGLHDTPPGGLKQLSLKGIRLAGLLGATTGTEGKHVTDAHLDTTQRRLGTVPSNPRNWPALACYPNRNTSSRAEAAAGCVKGETDSIWLNCSLVNGRAHLLAPAICTPA